MRINIQDKLVEKKMNKNQFAKLAQIGYPAACSIYDGKTDRIFFDTLEKVCIALDCTPNDILVFDDPKMQQRMQTYSLKFNELTAEHKSDTK